MFTQLVGFAYLIWWELSWDVMEPIAYMVGLTYSFMAYLYFLGTKGKTQFDYGAFNEYWTEQQLVSWNAVAAYMKLLVVSGCFTGSGLIHLRI